MRAVRPAGDGCADIWRRAHLVGPGGGALCPRQRAQGRRGMAFRAGGGSRLGHVAAVSKLVDARTVLISHSNWSPINGRRGHIERNVKAVDVSPNNDWSAVRVWYAPIKALGGRHWALSGFIYNRKPGAEKAEA